MMHNSERKKPLLLSILLSFELRGLESGLREVLGDVNVVHEASESTMQCNNTITANRYKFKSVGIRRLRRQDKKKASQLRKKCERSAPELVVVEEHVGVAVVESEDEAAAHLRHARAVHCARLHRREPDEQVGEAHAVLPADRKRPARTNDR